MQSILDTRPDECYVCKRYGHTDEHHVFGGANRKLSEHYGLKVYLCRDCHNKVHFSDGELMNILRIRAEARALEYYDWSIEQFIKIFGRNYL